MARYGAGDVVEAARSIADVVTISSPSHAFAQIGEDFIHPFLNEQRRETQARIRRARGRASFIIGEFMLALFPDVPSDLVDRYGTLTAIIAWEEVQSW